MFSKLKFSLPSTKPIWFFWIIVFIYVVSFWLILCFSFGGDLTGFFNIGQRQLIYRRYFRDLNYRATSLWGYDGQFYLAAAHDPFLKEKLYQNIDGPAYRYSRIGLPLGGWLLAFGQRTLIPPAMIFLNFGVFFLSVFLFLKIIERRRGPPWLVLIYSFLPFFPIGLFYSTADAFSASLMVIALFFMDEKKFLTASIIMTLAVLSKETAILLPAAAVIYFLWQKDFRKASCFLIPFLGYGLLSVIIFFNLHQWPFLGNKASINFNQPLVTVGQNLREIFHQGLSLPNLAKLIWMTSLLLAFIFSFWAFLKKPTIISLTYFFYGLFILVVSQTIWESYLGSGRIITLIGIFGIFCFLESGGKKHLIPPVIMVVSTFFFAVFKTIFPGI